MARYVLTLTEQHRAAVEAHRASKGLRSHAEAIRDLIERGTRDAALSQALGQTASIHAQFARVQPAQTNDPQQRTTTAPMHDDAPIGHVRTPYGSRLKKR